MPTMFSVHLVMMGGDSVADSPLDLGRLVSSSPALTACNISHQHVDVTHLQKDMDVHLLLQQPPLSTGVRLPTRF